MSKLFQSFRQQRDEQEAAPLGNTSSRRRFLRTSIVGATAVVPATLLIAQSAHASTGSGMRLSAEQAFHEIMKDEDVHVSFLKSALGGAARPKPTFKDLWQDDKEDFVNLAQVFENVGVGAYLMAAPAISDKGYLAAAGSILTIEARHAGYLDALVGKPLSPNGAFDKPISQSQIVADVMPFIASLNGGSDPSRPLTSDVDILNFALLLEYLEATFYDINVPKYYR